MPRSADYEVKLTQDHESFRHTIRDFAEKEIRPVAFEIDKKNKIPRELLDRIAKLGVPAITYKEEYGGLGGGMLPKGIWVGKPNPGSCARFPVFFPRHPLFRTLHRLGARTPEEKILLPLISWGQY